VPLSPAAPERLAERGSKRPPDSVRFAALGGQAVVAVSDAAGLDRAAAAVDRVVAQFDRACSRFRDDSELTAVNTARGLSVAVSPLLLEAIEAALRAATLTEGDVDLTVGRALIALGYDRDFGELPSDGSIPMPRLGAVPGWRTVEIDSAASTVRVPRGVALDLGSTAKALAADHAAEAAAEAAACGVLVSLSGDLAIAGPPPRDGWRIRVTDDHRSDASAPGQWITLLSGGLATSSTTARRWRTNEGVVHHLVDPSTGGPVRSHWRTVSVAAATCLDANIASTASIIRGETAADWLSELGLPSRLVSMDGAVRHLAGWPTDGDDLPAAIRSPTA
jgi:thiamine biosynthesis lipoprotein